VTRTLGITLVALLRRSLVGVFALTLLGPPIAAAQPTDSGLARFSQAVADYVNLVRRLHREVPELRVTDKSAEISNRSDMLAGAIQRARPGAGQGDFFDPGAARVIRERLTVALRGENVAAMMKRIDDEPILKSPAEVHLRFPTTSSMARMPARLLQALPPLPNGLEFRFVGRSLVLRDRDAALVLDYVPDALPKP
jgi:hypothetical protein